MAKKRDVVLHLAVKKRLENVIDLAQFKADRERVSMNRDNTKEALNHVLRWLPSVDELELADGLSRMLRFQCADGRTFFGIAANTAGKASSFFGAESAEGTTGSLTGLEWFIVTWHAGRHPAIFRQSELASIVSSGIGASLPLSQLSAVRRLVAQPGTGAR